MMNKKQCVRALMCVAAALMASLLCGCQPASLATTGITSEKGTALKQATEYKRNILQDISADGRLLLFYQTGAPTRSYTIPLGGGQASANQPPSTDDVLRVVERASGREVAQIKVGFFPEGAQFIPDTQQVFYKEPSGGSKPGWRFKTWNFSTGEAKACSDEDATSFRHATVVDARHILGAVLQENGGEVLGKLTLPDCSRTLTNPVNLANPKNMIWGGMNVSPSVRHLAYGAGEEVIIRDATTLNTIKSITPPSGLIFGGEPIYTPDGKFILVVASNTILDKPETKRYLLFYDTTNYEVARRLDITSWSPPKVRDDRAVSSSVVGTAMAISPDGRLLAVGNTREEKKAFTTTEQAQVTLYDLTTGEEVARASHPPVKQQRNDPFAAKVTRLAFTPDGKYLLSSTYDTLIWEVGGK